MRFLFLYLFIVLTLNTRSQQNILYQKEINDDYLKTTYSRDQVLSDIRFMLKVTKKMHPDFYHHFTRKELERKIDSLIAPMPDSVDVYEASIVTGQVAALFNEGHLGLVSNSSIIKQFNETKIRFPYQLLKMTDSTLIVYKDRSRSPKLSMFDTIISVNHIPVSELVKKFSDYYGGLPEWKNYKVRSRFAFLLFLNHIDAPYTIGVKRNGTTEVVANDSLAERQETRRKNENYNYKVIDNEIAYIDFYSMADYKSFKDSIQGAFNDIRKRNLNYLIIDLRKNGGGNSQLADHLLTYITKKPYRLASSYKMKISRPLKQYFRRDHIPLYWKVLSYLIPSGITRTSRFDAKAKKPSEPFFEGKTVFLIGPGTFSSANLLSNGIEDFDLAPLIGEPTAEPCNDYGDMIPFMLPNTKLIASAPYKSFVRANGNATDPNGVIPDYVVSPTREDILAGKDTVLEFAEDFIRKM